MFSTVGAYFRVTTFGESHGTGIGAVIDNCPPRLKLCAEDIQRQLDRRRPGQSDLTTRRKEADRVEIWSGVENGVTLGTPIALLVRNQDARPDDYRPLREVPRPSHADFTYQAKYGVNAASGGGRASARETAARVASGAVAEKLLSDRWQVGITAWVSEAAGLSAPFPEQIPSREDIDSSPVRCPHKETAQAMAAAITELREKRDSAGGIITAVCRGVPPGWGEPVFGRLEAMLAAAMMSIPSTKGFEIGSGFSGSGMRGSEHNDPFSWRNGRLVPAANRSGGVQGGISNGAPIVLRVAFKPPPTIGRAQQTVDLQGREVTLEAPGRHDPCVLPRAVPIVEAMAAIVLADAALCQQARETGRKQK